MGRRRSRAGRASRSARSTRAPVREHPPGRRCRSICPVPRGAPRWLIPQGNNSSHRAAFPLPCKSPSPPPQPSGCLLGQSSEPGEEKLGPVQSLAAASSPSQTAEESPFPLTNLPGGHRTGLRAGWEMLGRRSLRESGAGRGGGCQAPQKSPGNPQTQLAAGEAQPCPPPGGDQPLSSGRAINPRADPATSPRRGRCLQQPPHKWGRIYGAGTAPVG